MPQEHLQGLGGRFIVQGVNVRQRVTGVRRTPHKKPRPTVVGCGGGLGVSFTTRRLKVVYGPQGGRNSPYSGAGLVGRLTHEKPHRAKVGWRGLFAILTQDQTATQKTTSRKTLP